MNNIDRLQRGLINVSLSDTEDEIEGEDLMDDEIEGKDSDN